MQQSETQFPGLPPDLWKFGRIVCADFRGSEWHKPGKASVILLEDAATCLEIKIARGYAFSGRRVGTLDFKGDKTKGRWTRIRRRAAEVIGRYPEKNLAQVSTYYDYNVGEHPDDACLQLAHTRLEDGIIQTFSLAAAPAIAERAETVVDALASGVGDRLRPDWGGVFVFPLAAGAEFYLMDGTYVGTSVKSMGDPARILAEHTARVNRARYRSQTGYDYAKGFVREVFEINLLSDAHMNARLISGTVRNYAERHGSLRRSSFGSLWDWRLNPEELQKARADWENSGLVLSAERVPSQL